MSVTFNKSGLDEIMKDVKTMFSTEGMYELSNEAVNHFINNFNLQGFDGDPWVKGMKEVGATLVLSGQLRNSIRTLKVTDNSFTIISDTEYSEIHNEGGIIPITPSMRKFFWAMYYKTNNEDWKWLALTQGTSITIPQRKFMGDSEVLNQHLADFSKKYFK